MQTAHDENQGCCNGPDEWEGGLGGCGCGADNEACIHFVVRDIVEGLMNPFSLVAIPDVSEQRSHRVVMICPCGADSVALQSIIKVEPRLVVLKYQCSKGCTFKLRGSKIGQDGVFSFGVDGWEPK